MRRIATTFLALAVVTAAPAAADEFTDTMQSALEAYQAGDISGARADLDYAGKLLLAMKSESLAKLLPEAPAGWTKEAAESEEGAGFMGMLGGGTVAAATYRKGDEDFTITLVADSPMVSGIGAMITGMAGMTGGGKPLRIQRTEFATTDEGLQAVVDGKVMVSVTGTASVEDKTAALETMDFDALGDF